MTTDELISFTRYNKLRDRAVPPLWPDDVVVVYLNEAQQRLATMTDSFVEENRELEITAGQRVYPLDSDIVFVYAIQLAGYPGERLQPSTEGWTPDDNVASRPTRYTLDRAMQSIRFYQIPDQDYTANLRIARLPAPLSLDSLDATPELPEQNEHALMDWAAYRCFTHDDADGRNDTAAEKSLQRFNEHMNKIKRDNYRLRTGFQARAHGQRVK